MTYPKIIALVNICCKNDVHEKRAAHKVMITRYTRTRIELLCRMLRSLLFTPAVNNLYICVCVCVIYYCKHCLSHKYARVAAGTRPVVYTVISRMGRQRTRQVHVRRTGGVGSTKAVFCFCGFRRDAKSRKLTIVSTTVFRVHVQLCFTRFTVNRTARFVSYGIVLRSLLDLYNVVTVYAIDFMLTFFHGWRFRNTQSTQIFSSRQQVHKISTCVYYIYRCIFIVEINTSH